MNIETNIETNIEINTEKNIETNTETNIELNTNEINTGLFSEIIDSENNLNYYSYPLDSNIINLKNIYKNITFIDFSEEAINFIYKKCNKIRETDIIYIYTYDYNNSNSAINDYNYKFIYESRKECNLSLINEEIIINVYSPIKNPDIIKYDYFKYFSQQGYDI